jgi:hypothetical protein
MVQVTMESCKLRKEVAEHTGQSSQLFPVATGRNAKFLATVARSRLVRRRIDPRPTKPAT